MVSVAQPDTKNQIIAWLRGLLTVAWSDGDYDPKEQEIIAQLTQELALTDSSVPFQSITPEELADHLGSDRKTAENFLRTAVMVAVADGTYSTSEAELIRQFSQALGLEVEAIKTLEHTLYNPDNSQGAAESNAEGASSSVASAKANSNAYPQSDLLEPVRGWLDEMEVSDPRIARFVCNMVPSQCPFERDIKLFGRKIVHIPPLCKLNPLYEQLVGLRFRALSYLADDCEEDVSQYV